MRDMKMLCLLAVLLVSGFLIGCETTQTAEQGNQEQKRRVAVQQQQAQPQPDESDQNLQNAQADVINRGTNPAIRY
jgi:outer membrane lipoprotein-sorting protein